MKSRMSLEGLSIFALLILIGYFVADMGLLFLRGGMYPQPAPRATPLFTDNNSRGSNNVAGIRDRNIFNADGKIPPPIGAQEPDKPKDDGPPVLTNLPIQLIGTLVHANPLRSVASLGLKNKNDQIAIKVDQIIPDGIGPVLLIERNKVIFRNNQTSRREYVELKDDAKINFGAAKVQQLGEVLKKSDTDFELKRNDINKLTSNLPELLQQARAVPRMGPGGQIECFSMADIAPGSIYERLGLKRGDCIKSVNGEKIDSPAKAMELYNALRANADSINLGVERGGRDENFNYNITK